MNQVILIGRLTRNPELRFIPNSGTAVARFSLAVNREYKKDGQPDADFFNIVVWAKAAENCAIHLKKGRLCAINGNLRNNNYEDKNGTKHYNVEVVASRVEFLEWGSKQELSGSERQQHPAEPNTNNQKSDTGLYGFQPIDGDDDIPF